MPECSICAITIKDEMTDKCHCAVEWVAATVAKQVVVVMVLFLATASFLTVFFPLESFGHCCSCFSFRRKWQAEEYDETACQRCTQPRKEALGSLNDDQ
jgi:hypothetical protein